MIGGLMAYLSQVYSNECGNTGFHDEGIGYNPHGVFCGECNRATCRGCINENVGTEE